MVEDRWPELGGSTVRYRDERWELTGSVDVRESGDLLVVEGKQVDDNRHLTARFRFVPEQSPDSLNPGNLGEHFDSLEWDGDRPTIVVKTEGRTYRYELRGLEEV